MDTKYSYASNYLPDIYSEDKNKTFIMSGLGKFTNGMPL